MLRFDGQEPGALALCAALVRAGQRVCLIEPDPDDRARLEVMLPRLLGADAGLLEMCGAGAAPLSTDWRAGGSGPVLHHGEGAVAGHVIEQIGRDESGAVARIAGALGALHLVLPAGSIPLAARFHAALGRALEHALLRGSTPEALDAALVAAGFACGPFGLQDRLGVDTLLAQRGAVEAALGLPPLPLFARAVAEGRLGRKASVGWYRYPGRGGGAVEDPLVEDMAEEEARFAGLAREEAGEASLAAGIAGQMDALAAELVAAGAAPARRVIALAQTVIGYRAQLPAMRPSTTAASRPLPDR